MQLFNGYDYNGRVLKVHYDKFCAQTPFLGNIVASPQPSSNFTSTPVQATHSTLLQAAQLQHLVGGEHSLSQEADVSGLGTSFGLGTSDSETLLGLASRSRPTTSGNTTDLRAPLGFDPIQILEDPLQPRNANDVNLNMSSDDKLYSSISKSTSPRTSSRSPFDSFNLASSPDLNTALGTSANATTSLAERRQKIPAPLSASSSRPTSGSGLTSAFGGLGGLSINTGLSSNQVSISNNDLFAHSVSPISPAREKLSSTSAGVYSGKVESRKSFSNASPPPVSAPSSDKSPSKAITANTSILANQGKRSDSNADQQHPASTSPRQQHPAHPGHISLPPPAPLPAFPAHMQHHMQPMSPLMSSAAAPAPGTPYAKGPPAGLAGWLPYIVTSPDC